MGFKYYVGYFKDGKFKSRIERGTEDFNWVRFRKIEDKDLRIYYGKSEAKHKSSAQYIEPGIKHCKNMYLHIKPISDTEVLCCICKTDKVTNSKIEITSIVNFINGDVYSLPGGIEDMDIDEIIRKAKESARQLGISVSEAYELIIGKVTGGKNNMDTYNNDESVNKEDYSENSGENQQYDGNETSGGTQPEAAPEQDGSPQPEETAEQGSSTQPEAVPEQNENAQMSITLGQYNNIISTIKSTINDSLDSYFKNIDKRFENLENRLNEFDKTLERKERELSEKIKEANGLRTDLNNKTQEANGLRTDLDNKTREANCLRVDLDSKMQEADVLRRALDSKTQEFDSLRREYEEAAKPFIEIANIVFDCPSMKYLIENMGISDVREPKNILVFINRFGWDFTFARMIYESMKKYKEETREEITERESDLINAVNKYYKEKYGEQYEGFDALDCMSIGSGTNVAFDRRTMMILNDYRNYSVADVSKLYVPALRMQNGKDIERKAIAAR